MLIKNLKNVNNKELNYRLKSNNFRTLTKIWTNRKQDYKLKFHKVRHKFKIFKDNLQHFNNRLLLSKINYKISKMFNNNWMIVIVT